MGFEELEKRIKENGDKLEKLAQEIENNLEQITINKERIEHNSGALALLHTINSNSNKYFVIWLVTFICFLVSIGYIIFFK